MIFIWIALHFYESVAGESTSLYFIFFNPKAFYFFNLFDFD